MYYFPQKYFSRTPRDETCRKIVSLLRESDIQNLEYRYPGAFDGESKGGCNDVLLGGYQFHDWRFKDDDHGSATEKWYGLLFHELVRWTGHEKRLARKDAFGGNRKQYAFEKLVAELGAGFLESELGVSQISNRGTHHVPYVAGGLKLLKEDERAIFRASGAAGTAVKYLKGETE